MVVRSLKSYLRKSPKSLLLIGPRQTGKSTLIHELDPDLAIDLSDESVYLNFASNPSELNERLEGKSYRSVFIDEIQRLPSLLNTVQHIIDKNKRKKKVQKFYLTGSSARKLKRGQANLLPGRIFTFEIGGLCAAELDYRIDTAKALRHGFLPEPYLEVANISEQTLASYSATYLKEEIQAEALTRNLEGFSRFIFAAAERAGNILDLSKLSSKSKLSRQSVVRYFEILEDTLLVRKIQPFEPLVDRANLVKHPKFYLFDVGVLNGLLKNFTPSADRKGNLFEHLVVNQLYNSAIAKSKQIDVSFYRTRSNTEIDFIVKYEGKWTALEVKSSPHIDSKVYTAMNSFSSHFRQPHEKFVVFPEGPERKKEGVWQMPWQKFLKKVGL